MLSNILQTNSRSYLVIVPVFVVALLIKVIFILILTLFVKIFIGNYPQCQKCPEQQKPQQIYLNGNSTAKTFGVPAVAFSQTNGTTPVLLKATTTTTGTNKNSNKRKLSNVCGTGGGSTSPVPENIVACEF